MVALYDEQEVMERYVASERKGAAKEAAIETAVKMYRQFGKTIYNS